MPKRVRSYEERSIESLKDSVEAIAYLNAHLEDNSESSRMMPNSVTASGKSAPHVAQMCCNEEAPENDGVSVKQAGRKS